MRRSLKLLGIILTVLMVLYDIAELLAVPVLLVVIGLLNSFSWQYYVISIGLYFLLLLVGELIAHLIFKAIDKKYTPILERKIKKYFENSSSKPN